MRESMNEEEAGVVATGLCPLARDRRKVGDVECHEDALLVRSESQNLFVADSLERRLLVERAHVVSRLGQSRADPPPGDVCVE